MKEDELSARKQRERCGGVAEKGACRDVSTGVPHSPFLKADCIRFCYWPDTTE